MAITLYIFTIILPYIIMAIPLYLCFFSLLNNLFMMGEPQDNEELQPTQELQEDGEMQPLQTN
jgi:hypothetical protein